LPILAVGEFSISNAQIVGWRRDHKIDMSIREFRHPSDTIF
jgi:hypothetical protein